jgi:hypothetical protein
MTGALSILFLGGALAAPPVSSASPPSSDACRLLTAADVAAVQPGKLVESKPTASEAGGYAISDCFYRLDPFTSSISLQVTRRGPGKGGDDPAERWERMFRAEAGEGEREENGRAQESEESEKARNPEVRGIEKEKSPPLAVEGVGDEAFWIGNRASGVLYALARGRHAYVRVSVGGAGTEEEKRAKAVELARRALRRL